MLLLILSLVGGLIAGYFLKDKKIEISRPMQITLVVLIFSLGYDMGSKLDFAELANVGAISVIFAVITLLLSYQMARILRWFI
jgi:uncharacterized membrane protein YbjE (DUF340 family)